MHPAYSITGFVCCSIHPTLSANSHTHTQSVPPGPPGLRLPHVRESNSRLFTFYDFLSLTKVAVKSQLYTRRSGLGASSSIRKAGGRRVHPYPRTPDKELYLGVIRYSSLLPGDLLHLSDVGGSDSADKRSERGWQPTLTGPLPSLPPSLLTPLLEPRIGFTCYYSSSRNLPDTRSQLISSFNVHTPIQHNKNITSYPVFCQTNTKKLPR